MIIILAVNYIKDVFSESPSRPAKLHAGEPHYEGIMRKLSADLAVRIKVASVAAGSALRGFAGKQIGGLAGSIVPLVGRTIGKTSGKYVGATLRGFAGEIAGDKLAEVIVPLILDAASPGYINVEIRESHRPPQFFWKIANR